MKDRRQDGGGGGDCGRDEQGGGCYPAYHPSNHPRSGIIKQTRDNSAMYGM